MRKRRVAHSLQALLLVLTVGGCAAKAPPSLSDETRARLGRVGVVTVAFSPEVSLSGPTVLGGVGGGVKGALYGLGLGVLGGAGCFVSMGYAPMPCAVAVSTPYFMGRWTIEGAMKAVPERERRRDRDEILRAAGDASQERLLEGVLGEGRLRKDAALVPLTAEGPRSHGERSTYRRVAPNDVDTVAEVALLRISLEVVSALDNDSNPWKWSFASAVDPWLRLDAEARLRVVSIADDAVLFARTFRYSAGRARLGDWARDEAAEFRTARDEALKELARQIAGEVFGSLPQPGESGEKPPLDTPPPSDQPTLDEAVWDDTPSGLVAVGRRCTDGHVRVLGAASSHDRRTNDGHRRIGRFAER